MKYKHKNKCITSGFIYKINIHIKLIYIFFKFRFYTTFLLIGNLFKTKKKYLQYIYIMRLRANQMCHCILIFLAIFLIYQIVCNCNKKSSLKGGEAEVEEAEAIAVEDNNAVDSDTQIESDSDLDYNDPDYYNYEPVVNDNARNENETELPL